MAVARHTSDSARPWLRAEAALGGGGEWTEVGDGEGPGAGAAAAAAMAMLVSLVGALFASINALSALVVTAPVAAQEACDKRPWENGTL